MVIHLLGSPEGDGVAKYVFSGSSVVSSSVVGCSVVGCFVVGCSVVVGCFVVGCSVVGCSVVVGCFVVGCSVVGSSVVIANVVAPNVLQSIPLYPGRHSTPIITLITTPAPSISVGPVSSLSPAFTA